MLVTRRVEFGARLAVVGAPDTLGAWTLEDGLQLAWSEGDVWAGDVLLPPGTHEFKVRRLPLACCCWARRFWAGHGL
jgi:hypothetical protein